VKIADRAREIFKADRAGGARRLYPAPGSRRVPDRDGIAVPPHKMPNDVPFSPAMAVVATTNYGPGDGPGLASLGCFPGPLWSSVLPDLCFSGAGGAAGSTGELFCLAGGDVTSPTRGGGGPDKGELSAYPAAFAAVSVAAAAPPSGVLPSRAPES
jgi:hypothetical protein